MRKTTSVALLSLCLVLVSTSTTNAISPANFSVTTDNQVEAVVNFYDYSNELVVLDVPLPEEAVNTSELTEQNDSVEEKKEDKEEQEIVRHTVEANDSLSTISKEYDVEWQRIFAKNPEIENPDYLEVGDEVVIPAEDEDLELRELPQAAPEVAPVAAVAATPRASQSVSPPPATVASTPAPVVAPPVSSGGNTYYRGYCTWHVKNLRPDLPNSLGNANTWFARAQAMGPPTGTHPRVGAAATTTSGALGHVAYVQAVHGDGTVTVSEMNYSGWNISGSRRVAASSFVYIY